MEDYMIYKPEIRFADIDSYGIVHNAKFLLFFEESRINLFKNIAGVWDWKKRGFLVASQKVDYSHPVTLNDELEIVVWVKSVGEKSLTLAYEAYLLNDGGKVLSAESETVIVCYDNTVNTTVSVPSEWMESIEKNGLLGRPSMC